MMGAQEELRVKWPAAFWDDWMREPGQRLGRACIRPELSRTAMSAHGKAGVSRGLWYDQHLRHIRLSTHPVPFQRLAANLTATLAKAPYDAAFFAKVDAAPGLSLKEAIAQRRPCPVHSDRDGRGRAMCD